MDIHRIISLDHPIRRVYHFVRGWLAFSLYGNPSRDMTVIGITGTKGKTTVTNIVAQGLIDAGKKVFMFSTARYCIGDTFYENTTKMTSPNPFVLQRLLREARAAGCEYAVIETSSHAIYFHRNYGIEYDTVVLTNIAQDHLDLHGTMDAYAHTKFQIFERLNYARKRLSKKLSVVNADDAYAPLFLSATTDGTFTFGIASAAQVVAQDIRYLPEGTEFTVKIPSNRFTVRTRLRGEFNVYNALCAFATLNAQQIPPESIARTLETFPGVAGRLEAVENTRGITIFVDYAHTEDSLRSVLETVRRIEGRGRIILALGSTGDRDKTKRPKMGKVADELADVIILTDEDTYTENSLDIIRDLKRGIKRRLSRDFWIIPSREDAIRTAIIMAEPGDIVLLANKGAETQLMTNAGPVPWRDTEVVRRILTEIDDQTLAM